MAVWQPKTEEDRLIDRYGQDHGGRYFLEVPTGSPRGRGRWPTGSGIRRIDAVRVEGPSQPEFLSRAEYTIEEFAAAVDVSGLSSSRPKSR